MAFSSFLAFCINKKRFACCFSFPLLLLLDVTELDASILELNNLTASGPSRTAAVDAFFGHSLCQDFYHTSKAFLHAASRTRCSAA